MKKGQHRQGSFLRRYTRKGINYSRACEQVQTKMVEAHERKESKANTADVSTR